MSRGSALQAVVSAGRRHQTPRLDFFWRPNDIGHPRLAVVVPRYGHTAVERNRLRRRVRERARRDILRKLSALDLVVRVRRSAYAAGTDEIGEDLDQWLGVVSR